MISLIYVSLTLIDPDHRTRILDDVETVSLSRNTTLDITGVLIAARQHFVQLIEGPEANVAVIMKSIMADPRHTGIKIVRRSNILKEETRCWRMVRFHTENFGDMIVTPVLVGAMAGNADAVRRLERLIETVAEQTAFSR